MSGRIAIRGLTKVFGPRPAAALAARRAGASRADLLAQGHLLALEEVTLEIEPGSVHVVMGLSGSGKSTLLRHVNRLIEPTEGEIRVDGQDVRAMGRRQLREFRRARTAMVFQGFGLLPHRTAAQNVTYGLALQGRPRAQMARRGAEWIARVGLEGHEDRYPAELSGGMAQRVGLARALATGADILLMDEAFSALDPLIRAQMQDLLLGLQRDLGRTILFITHDLEEALRLGDRVSILREGRLVQTAPPAQIVLHPADDHVAAFTRRLDRGRLLRLGDLALPPSGAAIDLALPAALPLVEALGPLARAGRARLTDAAGAAAGEITLETVLAALAPAGAGPG